MRKPLSPALCVLLTTCNHDPEAYIPHREMAGLSGLSHLVAVVGCDADRDTGGEGEDRPVPAGDGLPVASQEQRRRRIHPAAVQTGWAGLSPHCVSRPPQGRGMREA